MKKIIALLLACMMIVGMFAGCQSAKTEEITLKVWAPQEDHGDDTKWLNQMLKKFEEAHPEYKITWDIGVCGEGDAKTLVCADASAAGDVYMFANDQIGSLLEAGALSKLGGEYADYVKNNYSSTYINSVTYNGDIYGFPMTCNTWFMYYNKSLVSDEDVKTLEALLEKGTVAFPMTTAWYNGALFLGNGCTLFGETGADAAAGVQFGGEAGYAAALRMVELMAHPNFIDDADSKGNTGLKDGSVVAYFNGSWEYTNQDKTGVYDVLGENLGAAAMPTVTIDGKAVNLTSMAGSKAVGVNPHCKNPKAAMELAAFLASPEAQLARFEIRGITPAVTSLASNEKVMASAVAKAEMEVMANCSVLQPSLPEMSSYWDAMGTFGANIKNGVVTKDNYKAEVDKLMEALNPNGGL